MNMVIAQPQIAADIFPAMPAPRSPRQQYSDGYVAFCNLEDMTVLTTEYERKGYLQAMKDCADLETDIYLVKSGVVR